MTRIRCYAARAILGALACLAAALIGVLPFPYCAAGWLYDAAYTCDGGTQK